MTETFLLLLIDERYLYQKACKFPATLVVMPSALRGRSVFHWQEESDVGIKTDVVAVKKKN